MRQIRPEVLAEAARRLEAAPRGAKGVVVAALAREWGMHSSRVREHLCASGLWESGRARRSDAGRSELIADTEVYAMAELLQISRRATGKFLADIEQAREILAASGRISAAAAGASPATWARHLRRLRVAKVDLAAPSLATELDSLHPNHVHCVDASIGILFFLDKGRMRFRRLDLMDPKNKPAQFASEVRARRLLVRWVGVDHYSGAIYVEYREATGETAPDLIDFLHGFWDLKTDRRLPVHGVPQVLYADQGAPQKSAPVQALCKALGVRLILHESSHRRDDASAARATGAVEVANRIWESEFEGRWRVEPPTGGLEQIQAQTSDFLVRLNGDPRHKLTRAGMTRSQLWMTIRDDQLRLAPSDLDEFRALAVARPAERVLDAYGRVSVDGHLYKLRDCQWSPGERVQVRLDPWDAGRASVTSLRTGEVLEAQRLQLRPNSRSSAAAMIGQQDDREETAPSARQPLHPAARLRKEVGDATRLKNGIAEPGTLRSGLGSQADQVPAEVVAFVPRVGTPILAPASGRRLDDWDVSALAVDRLGRALTPEDVATITARLGGGKLDELAAIELVDELAQQAGHSRKILRMGRGA